MSRKKMTTSKDELKTKKSLPTEAQIAKALSSRVQEAEAKPKVTRKKKATNGVTSKEPSQKKVAKKKVTKKASSTKKVSRAKKVDAPEQAAVSVERPESPKSLTTKPAAPVVHAEPIELKIDTPPGLPEWSLTDHDVYLFNEGRHFHLYRKLGAHQTTEDGKDGYRFTIWAPNAKYVSVIGEFNGWDREAHQLTPVQSSGLWSGFLPEAKQGQLYKFFIHSQHGNHKVEKADPFAFYSEIAPNTASITWDSVYQWSDTAWMKERGKKQAADGPISIYELHLGSWRRKHDDNFYSLSYRELAEKLPAYVKSLGFTHVEFMPILEHPFFGSWGYQVTSFFAPTSRFGTPDDLKYLIDRLHQEDIGVILDWVPSHFPSDEHGLSFFDGTHLFEHSDPREGYHPDWNSMIFNFGRNEVRSFLISSANFWLEEFHIDGLRVDAVASMLYRDYSRKEGEWIPNIHGGRENYEAIDFLKQLNETVYLNHPDIHMIAEESTAWPMVSRPTSMGGLGFGMKWDMGWMHDTLKYFQYDPVHRKHHHNELSFRMVYAFNENFVLSISHDEVVHGKKSLLDKMPGDRWQKFANLRTLYGYMFAQPGKKLLFMGSEFGQWSEWNHDGELEWELTNEASHRNLQKLLTDLNSLYRSLPALHQTDFDPKGFEWVESNDWEQSVYSFLRFDKDRNQIILAVINMTPVPRYNYQLGVPVGGSWSEIFNSDAQDYGGSGHGNMGGVEASPVPSHGRSHSLNLTLPPLGVIYLKTERPLHGKRGSSDESSWSSFQ